MKHEWKKLEKQFYLPKDKPELINIPSFKFFTIEGKGNPNSEFFSEYIAILYSLSYAVKMSPKKGLEPKGYFEYTVYPLEGIWDISDEAKKSDTKPLNKDDLVFKLMMRQPDFVDNTFASFIIDFIKQKKPNPLLDKVQFEEITDGQCVQMMHLGSYDNESESFKRMSEFAQGHGFTRKEHSHREIYLSDARKVPTDKLRTVLRIRVE